MEKLKLTEKQKFCLLQDASCDIISQGRNYHYFISPYDVDSIKFNVGAFSKKHGCRVEVVYHFNNCVVRLLWHYVKKRLYELIDDFIFIPKAITIDREFKNSILISILPDPVSDRYCYQSLKSIYELCVEDSEGGEDADAGEQASVCHEGESVNPHATLDYCSENLK